MAPLILTMVRHGESVDNLSALWAGRRDAPLTHHGFNQSLRLAKEFENVPITAIYASDLKRAQTTAQNIWELNKAFGPKGSIPFTVSPLLQEQYFGEAEGQPWDTGLFASLNLPWEDARDFRLAPSAESLTDVQTRATAALRHFLLPHLIASHEGESHHVVLVAHGIFLSEMNYAIVKAGEGGDKIKFVKKGAYTNTGWSRWEIHADPSEVEEVVSLLTNSNGSSSHPPPPIHVSGTNSIPLPHPRHDSLPPSLPPAVSTPTLRHKIVAFNKVEHLEGLERQGGGIGSAAHDAKQRTLEAFFGGGGAVEKE